MATSRRRTTVARRKRIWTRDFGTDVILGTAPFARDLMALWQVSGGPNLIGCTVVRNRLTLAAARTSGASVLPHIIWGVVVAEASADAADLDPSLAAAGLNLDWMYWSKEYMTGDGVAVAALGSADWTVDVKAMRKLEELGQTLWLVGVSTLADNYAISWGCSSLVLLP